MDKITAVIILLIIGFWGYLKFYHGAESWVAMMNDGSGELGSFSSYSECVDGVKSQIDVETVSYICTRD